MTITLEEVKRLHLNPGDALVLRVPDDISPEARLWLTEQMKAAFPDHRTVVLTEGFTLEVVEAAA